jgi:hypothetical protein
MKLIKIELIENCNVVTVTDGRQLQPVLLTFKKFWGGKVKMKAFPTSYGPIFRTSGRIRYFIYCDELGKELDDEISEQINNYLINLIFSK